MNILFTSAGRRVELLKIFQQLLRKKKGKIFAADADPTAPTLHVADKSFIVPPIKSPKYLKSLLEISKKNKINLIIPLEDLELPILASNEDLFKKNGIQLLISSHKSVKLSNDKFATSIFFKKNRIPIPPFEILNEGISNIKSDLEFPVILKPRYGDGGKGVFRCKDLEELEFFAKRINFPIVQQFINGSEVTIDVFGDGSGSVFSLVPRKRLKVRAGEVERAVTIDDELFREHIIRIASKFKPFGPINIQCIVTSEVPFFIEINARFGGGYPLSDKAGAKFPNLLLDLVNGKSLTSYIGKYQKGLVMGRYDEAVFQDVTNLENSKSLINLS